MAGQQRCWPSAGWWPPIPLGGLYRSTFPAWLLGTPGCHLSPSAGSAPPTRHGGAQGRSLSTDVPLSPAPSRVCQGPSWSAGRGGKGSRQHREETPRLLRCAGGQVSQAVPLQPCCSPEQECFLLLHSQQWKNNQALSSLPSCLPPSRG